MQTIPHNKVLNRTPPEISNTEQALPHYTRRLLPQLRTVTICTNKSPILHEYLHKITPETHPTPNCPLCSSQPHDTLHIFGCPRLPTDLGPEALWNDPGPAGLLARWSDRLGWGLERGWGGGACRSPWGRQQQLASRNNYKMVMWYFDFRPSNIDASWRKESDSFPTQSMEECFFGVIPHFSGLYSWPAEAIQD